MRTSDTNKLTVQASFWLYDKLPKNCTLELSIKRLLQLFNIPTFCYVVRLNLIPTFDTLQVGEEIYLNGHDYTNNTNVLVWYNKIVIYLYMDIR